MDVAASNPTPPSGDTGRPAHVRAQKDWDIRTDYAGIHLSYDLSPRAAEGINRWILVSQQVYSLSSGKIAKLAVVAAACDRKHGIRNKTNN